MAKANTADDQFVQSTALMVAVGCNQQEAANLLLDHRADPSIASSKGFTPLMGAALLGSLSIVRKLIKREVDMDDVESETG